MSIGGADCFAPSEKPIFGGQRFPSREYLIWNCDIHLESSALDHNVAMDLVKTIAKLWDVDETKATVVLAGLIAQKRAMFPPEVQIKAATFMVLRDDPPLIDVLREPDKVILNS